MFKMALACASVLCKSEIASSKCTTELDGKFGDELVHFFLITSLGVATTKNTSQIIVTHHYTCRFVLQCATSVTVSPYSALLDAQSWDTRV